MIMTVAARILLLKQAAIRNTSMAIAGRQTLLSAHTTAKVTSTSKIGRRFFGAQTNPVVVDGSSSAAATAAAACKYENLVQETIKKMMTNKDASSQGEDKKPISNEELEVRFNYYTKVFEEAGLCLSDLRETLFEADVEQYREECNCAEGAVNNAFTAYVDLLEDLRRSNEEQLLTYREIRNTNACNLKRLRKELDQIIEVAENRNIAAS